MAGVGTRFFPVCKVLPKELLPIGDKPVIQWLVEEAVQSGIEKICFVLSSEKELIRRYFSEDPALEKFLKERGKNELLPKIQGLPKMAEFSFVYQATPEGDGDALLQAEAWVGREPFLVLFGDDLVKSTVPAGKQLLDEFKGEAVIAVEKVAREELNSYGVIDPGEKVGRRMQVKGLVEKPKPAEAPSELGIIGKYACPPSIFAALRQIRPRVKGELRLIDGLRELLKQERVWAYEIEGERFDTGRPEGLFKANQRWYNRGDLDVGGDVSGP